MTLLMVAAALVLSVALIRRRRKNRAGKTDAFAQLLDVFGTIPRPKWRPRQHRKYPWL